MILFVGQVSRDKTEREALQELDCRAVFGSMTKLATEIEDSSRVPEIVSRAFHTATGGRPGPVVVGLPEDMLTERIAVLDAPPFAPVETWPGPSDMAALERLLAGAQRPFLILGGSRWSEEACTAIAQFAQRFALPVATSYRRLPLFDPLHPCYAGDLGIGPNPKLVARLQSADLVVVAGGRLGELPSQGYTLFDIPSPKPLLVHIHPGAEELGRIYCPHLAIHAAPAAFAQLAQALRPPAEIPWREQTVVAHADYLDWTQSPTEQPGAVNLGAVMVWLRENLSPDTILCNGAGNYAAWIHRFYRFRRFATHIAPTSASMGYGVPSAVAMKRLHPQRTVVSVNGDGDFLMNGQEFATAVHYRLPIVVIVCDNGIYGTIRMHQEREYPGRVSATGLTNPDFGAYARAFGGFGATVEKTEDFPAAFRAAEQAQKPAIIHLKIDPDASTPAMTLTQIRAKARATQTA
jgi:acetolactate synthase-1/2/3 large subunit